MKVNKSMKFKAGNKSKLKQTAGNQQKSDGPKVLTRKALRKQARIEKKARKHAYFTNQRFVQSEVSTEIQTPVKNEHKAKETIKEKVKDVEKERKKRQQKLEKEKAQQLKRRKQFMLEENEREDKNIAQLSKWLKMDRRKNKSLPQCFANDGLDFVLDVVDPEKIPHLLEPELSDDESDFQNDFALVTGQAEADENEEPALKKKKKVTFAKMPATEAASDAEQSEESMDYDESSSVSDEDEQQEVDSEEEMSDNEGEDSEESDEERICSDGGLDEESMEDSDGENSDSAEEKNAWKNRTGDNREDIYGRLRDNEGNVLTNKNGAQSGGYIPPAQRQASGEVGAGKPDSLHRLKYQLERLLNSCSESNVCSIANKIEELYMHNIRNDMNNALINLIMKAVVVPSLTKERIVQEYALLIALIHANVGTEVGARFLESIGDKFKMFRTLGENYGEEKECDNLLLLLVHLYTFKVVHSSLLYDILQVLADSFKEKDVELILLILRSGGFSLRKDDPLRLKSVIVKLQSQALASSHLEDQSRVKFMLEILMAIGNNNMRKIPNYDPSHTEHLKKLLRNSMRKGNGISELKVSLDDLLNAEARGRWWIVGSAWSGQATVQDDLSEGTSGQLMLDATNNVSEKILELARKQRMNTDVRKNIFCIIMSAEDYVDAFEKLLRLGLNNQQEREILHVAIDCCLQEKTFNPYYAFLMQRFCNSDRKYKLIIQFSVWDKIKEMATMTSSQMSNLARLLAHLFLEKGLAISVLKVIEFAEMNKTIVRFLRQILLEILLHDPEEDLVIIFFKVTKDPKLHVFRERLRLFMQHFMLRNKEKLPAETQTKLEARINLAEGILTSCEVRTKF